MTRLQNDIDARIRKPAQWKFYDALYESWKEAKNAPGEQPAEALIPSHYFFFDAAKLALHWRLYYWPYTAYNTFGIPEKPMDRIIGWSQKLVSFFIILVTFLAQELQVF